MMANRREPDLISRRQIFMWAKRKLKRTCTRVCVVYVIAFYILYLSFTDNLVHPLVTKANYPYKIPVRQPENPVTPANPPVIWPRPIDVNLFRSNFSLYPLSLNFSEVLGDKWGHNVIPINPQKFSFIHNGGPCDLTGSPRLVVMVKSAAWNHHLRTLVRSTWGEPGGFPNVKVFFLLAQSDDFTQTIVNEESRVHQDIIQQNFQEAYFNNTFKTVMGFDWSVEHCAQSQYFVFVDDDFVVDVNRILQFIKNEIPDHLTDDVMLGQLVPCGVPYRNKDSKWSLSWAEYPLEVWPPYLAGGAFLVSQNIVRRMSRAFPYIKYTPIDDAYLGIVARKLNIWMMDDIFFHTGRHKKVPNPFIWILEDDPADNSVKPVKKQRC